MKTEFDDRWSELSREAMKEIKQWRLSHPKATLNQIERALDEQLGQLRARMLEDLAQASDAAQMDEQMTEWPRCPQCGDELSRRGRRARDLETDQHQQLHLERAYATCPRCGVGLFPPG